MIDKGKVWSVPELQVLGSVQGLTGDDWEKIYGGFDGWVVHGPEGEICTGSDAP